MKIGTITLKGTLPFEIDGLYMGESQVNWRFILTSEGLERKGKLYKTFDVAYLAEKMGFTKYKYTTKYQSIVKGN